MKCYVKVTTTAGNNIDLKKQDCQSNSVCVHSNGTATENGKIIGIDVKGCIFLHGSSCNETYCASLKSEFVKRGVVLNACEVWV